MDNETTAVQQKTEFVFRRLTEALTINGKEQNPYLWLVLLIPLVCAGIFYVVWMYRRDAHTVGWAWSTFLGLLRCTVYIILAFMFLLPATQNWEEREIRSKVLLVMDVSDSMGSKDDMPVPGQSEKAQKTRQDKVIAFLTKDNSDFLTRLQQKNPISVYRFGSVLDEESRLIKDSTAKDETLPTASDWNAWLKPENPLHIPKDLSDEELLKAQQRAELHALLSTGTNLGDSVLGALNRESNNIVTGVIVVSDGRSTQLSESTFVELQARARKANVPIFTIGVGSHREPISLRITDLMAPDHTRPDDKYPVRVEIDGVGLAGQKVPVSLDVYAPNADKPSLELTLEAEFKRGEPPHAQVEFPIVPADLPAELRETKSGNGKPEMLLGKWKFVARVPRDPREIIQDKKAAGDKERVNEKEHISDPEYVNVVKKAMRVLLFAGAPTRDYQFTRTLFVREVDEARAEMSIYLQLAREGILQDVKTPEQFLKDFPSTIRDPDDPDEKPEEKFNNLMQYDVIIAFDPDWTKLRPEQLASLKTWVYRHGGGLILVGGPVNTYQLARNHNQEDLKPILDLYPVFLADNRVEGIDRSTAEPWRLKFTSGAADMEFLNLDDEVKEPLSGWEQFFAGQKGAGADPTQRRGFFDFYPVKEVKPSAIVIANFGDPAARTKDGKEQPYLVSMPYGSGKVFYIGSGEVWRLRQAREAFHERFWTKLCRYVGSGTQIGKKSRGVIVMGKTFAAGNYVHMEAKLLGPDMKPLPPTVTPEVTVVPPGGVTMAKTKFPMNAKISLQQWNDMKPEDREKNWEGWFSCRFLVASAGNNYEVLLPIPGEAAEKLSSKFKVEPSSPELDNTRPDFQQLRLTATPAGDVLRRLDDEPRAKFKRTLERTNQKYREGTDEKDLRLFFDMTGATEIPDVIGKDNRPQKTRGRIEDLWDWGFTFGDPPLKLSLALLVVIALLSVEWLTRKLLKLA